MLKLVLYYGPYAFETKTKYRKIKLHGIIRLLKVASIPFELERFHYYDRFAVELDGQTVYMCRLTNLESDSDGSDYNSVTAFEAIREAYLAAKRYYSKKDNDKVIFEKNTGEKCFSNTFDSFYLESFFEVMRVPCYHNYHHEKTILKEEVEAELEVEMELDGFDELQGGNDLSEESNELTPEKEVGYTVSNTSIQSLLDFDMD